MFNYQAFCDQLCDEFGFERIPVNVLEFSYFQQTSLNLFFNKEKQSIEYQMTIVLTDIAESDPAEVVLHEFRHYYQAMIGRLVLCSDIYTKRLKSAWDNTLSEKSSGSTKEEHESLPWEVDANEWAANRLDIMRSKQC